MSSAEVSALCYRGPWTNVMLGVPQNMIIQRHGHKAEFVACRRVDRMIERGEAAWKRILSAIKDVAPQRAANRRDAGEGGRM